MEYLSLESQKRDRVLKSSNEIWEQRGLPEPSIEVCLWKSEQIHRCDSCALLGGGSCIFCLIRYSQLCHSLCLTNQNMVWQVDRRVEENSQ